jgi:hypothetical protein
MKASSKQKSVYIPQEVQPFLWSYDISDLDLEKHKKRIITNVLNYGTRDATNWVKETCSDTEIRSVLADSLPGEWLDKSLNYWSLVYDVEPGSTERNIPEDASIDQLLEK